MTSHSPTLVVFIPSEGGISKACPMNTAHAMLESLTDPSDRQILHHRCTAESLGLSLPLVSSRNENTPYRLVAFVHGSEIGELGCRLDNQFGSVVYIPHNWWKFVTPVTLSYFSSCWGAKALKQMQNIDAFADWVSHFDSFFMVTNLNITDSTSKAFHDLVANMYDQFLQASLISMSADELKIKLIGIIQSTLRIMRTDFSASEAFLTQLSTMHSTLITAAEYEKLEKVEATR